MLSRLGQQHRAEGNVICPVEPVDGTPIFVGECRRSAGVIQAMVAAKRFAAKKRAKNDESGKDFDAYYFLKSTDGVIAGEHPAISDPPEGRY